ncbi:hypothetical protein [Bacillus suaedae]|uniref:Uncharacterized protein n=1 Tax=Halalkalibacter suaedae TaxID=2822140 RepID=A0A940WXP2_9BACI|nr:hypothetical protein [Bacillus suaedae]MBP3952567.1 hypothetical protein [Bacillus suaedae]
MSERSKYLLIAFILLAQLVGFVFIFINASVAIVSFVIHFVGTLILFILFIKERRKEKEEEIDYDDCDY